jgi:UDP-3-O-[3-hydroxymyristoyl] N-acetylglucosamine deacetylase
MGQQQVITPEHLLAALVGLGVTDAVLTLDGPEVPIRDGSALPWCVDLQASGLVEGPQVEPLRLATPIEHREFGGVALAWPADRAELEVSVDYGAEGLPRGEAQLVLDPGDFVEHVAWARTFVLERDISAALKAGRGKGATADNTIVWTPRGPRHPMRAPDEVVRHKLLDLVGDLALVGRPFVARIRVEKGSHRLHHALVRRLLANG